MPRQWFARRREIRVESALLQVHDPNFLEAPTERFDQDLDQVVSQRPRRLDSLLFENNRGSFGLPDPDRQVPIAVGLSQQQDRLILRLLDTNSDHTHFAHRACLQPDVIQPTDSDAVVLKFYSSVPPLIEELSDRDFPRTADLTRHVCKVSDRAASSRTISSARSRAPASRPLATGPAI